MGLSWGLIRGRLGEMGKMDPGKLGLQEPLVFGPQQGQIIERRIGGGRRGLWIGGDLGMGGGDDLLRLGLLDELLLEPDLQPAQIEGIKAHLNALPA